MSERNHHETIIRCEQIEQLAVLYACDELDPGACAALEAHGKQCPACAAVLSREARMHRVIASFDQPADTLDRSGLLLSQCRSELAEALDDKQARADQPGWRAAFLPAAWWAALRGALVYHPALSMAVLVVAGFLAGVAGQRSHVTSPVSPRPVVTVSAAPKLTEQQLQSAASANVAWVTPSGSQAPTVQVQLMSQTPMSIVGSPDDTDVQRALTFVLANGQRFDPGVRLDSLEVLRTRSSDPDVRRAICTAARTDHNPGVRMKALETLQGLGQDALVQQTLIEALANDSNSGVRVEAINLLVNALRADSQPGSADPQILSVLRDRLRNDPNNYIRLQSAAALRQLGSGDLP
ncbi:MAG: HEAT repeat domain-containing protein [Acidobacteriia bacterium]|nr:HEAT repeat domain-containing protein [Terriglobia bacterium]